MSLHDVIHSDELHHAEGEAGQSNDGCDDSDDERPADEEGSQRVHALSKVHEHHPVVTLDVVTKVSPFDPHHH